MQSPDPFSQIFVNDEVYEALKKRDGRKTGKRNGKSWRSKIRNKIDLKFTKEERGKEEWKILAVNHHDSKRTSKKKTGILYIYS